MGRHRPTFATIHGTMKNLSTLHTMPWVCMGDFNEVLRHDEHVGIGNRSQAQIQGFRDVVDVCGLVDLGYKGTRWTFEKRVAGGSFTRVRLDRALGLVEWCSQFPSATVEHLTAATLDHLPILIQLAQPPRGRRKDKQFRYEVMRETHPDLKSTVQLAWEANGHNLTARGVRAKLDALASNLGDWSKSTFGSVKGEIRSLKKELERLQSDIARIGPSHVEIKINDRLIELYLCEELMRRQRPCVEWLAAGNQNSLFFHMRVSMQ